MSRVEIYTKSMLTTSIIDEPLGAFKDSLLIDDSKLSRSLVGALHI